MGGDHGHGHHGHGGGLRPGRMDARTARRRLAMVLGGGLAIMTLEVVGGIWANSLVLLADAAHYATDVGAVLLALLAASWAMRPATSRRTFGQHRAEVLAAFVNALALWLVSAVLVWHAVERIQDPGEVDGRVVLAVGGVSLVANIGLAALLRPGSAGSVNVRAAYVHILSDVLGSAAAVAAGALSHFYGLDVADPILTLLVTGLIVAFTWRLTRDTVHILMQGTPPGVDPERVRADILGVRGVSGLHDLHMWHVATGVDALTVHVTAEAADGDRVVREVTHLMAERHGIRHVTVQVERAACPCALEALARQVP